MKVTTGPEFSLLAPFPQAQEESSLCTAPAFSTEQPPVPVLVLMDTLKFTGSSCLKRVKESTVKDFVVFVEGMSFPLTGCEGRPARLGDAFLPALLHPPGRAANLPGSQLSPWG